MAACRTLAVFLDRARIQFVFLVEQIHFSMICINVTVTSVPARIYTVEEINAALYTLENIGRCSDTHQICRFFFWQIRNHFIENMIHLLVCLSYRKTADGISVKIHLGNPFCMIDTDIFIDCSLIDTKQQLVLVDGILSLVQFLHFILASLQPSCRTVHGILHITAVRHTRWALVEGHRNRGCQIGLDLHTLLRSHKDLSSVYVGVEINSLLLDFPKACKREYLESAGVGQDRFIPDHKLVESAHLLYDLVARTHVEVIRVGELYLRADLLEILSGNGSLDRCRGSDIHEYRRLDIAVHGFHVGALRSSFHFQNFIHNAFHPFS